MILKLKDKVHFDIADKSHMEIFKKFYTKKAWGGTGCPFVLEEPYTNIPVMIMDKIVKQHLGIKA